MYVCVCHAITEEKLEKAVMEAGKGNSKEVLRRLGIGGSCGVCLIDAIGKMETLAHSKGRESQPLTPNQKSK